LNNDSPSDHADKFDEFLDPRSGQTESGMGEAPERCREARNKYLAEYRQVTGGDER
jgi:hypothetical protein